MWPHAPVPFSLGVHSWHHKTVELTVNDVCSHRAVLQVLIHALLLKPDVVAVVIYGLQPRILQENVPRVAAALFFRDKPSTSRIRASEPRRPWPRCVSDVLSNTVEGFDNVNISPSTHQLLQRRPHVPDRGHTGYTSNVTHQLRRGETVYLAEKQVSQCTQHSAAKPTSGSKSNWAHHKSCQPYLPLPRTGLPAPVSNPETPARSISGL